MHDPAESASDFDEPAEGARYVAVDLTVANAGAQPYDDHVALQSTLVDTQDVAHDTAFGEVAECDRIGAVTITPGDQRSGCLVFELDENRNAGTFQYRAGSSLDPQLGEWDLTETAADPADPQAQPDYPAATGQSLTLQTRDAGEIEVTVDAVHDPAELTSEFAETSTATRHLAVELTVTNPGGDTYDDHVGINSTLVDTADVAHDTAIDDVAECDRIGDVTISPGDQRRGCVVFEIDDTRDPRAFQYQTGTDLGEWDLS